MSQKDKHTLSLSVIDSLDATIHRSIIDNYAANADDLAPIVLADRVTLQYGVGLDTDQREALANVAGLLDTARDKQSTIRPRHPGRLVDQHRTELGRKASLTRVGELLETAFGTASQANVQLKVNVDQVWSMLLQEYTWRAVVRAVPAKPAIQNHAA